MNKQTANGKHEINGFSGMSVETLEKELEKFRKPGRPSSHVLALRNALEIKRKREIKKPAPEIKTRGRGKKHEEPAEAKPEKVKIFIPPIETGVLKCRVQGMNSLIMHAWNVKSIRQIEEKQQMKAKAGRVKRDPKAEWHAARYLDDRGRDCVPALSFKNAIVAAASFLPDVTKTLLKGAIFIRGQLLPISFKGRTPVFRKDMVRIGGMSKTADVRYRPEYPRWQIDLEIEFDNTVISAEQVVNLVARAGFNVGVGEWRPQFGRFRVVRT